MVSPLFSNFLDSYFNSCLTNRRILLPLPWLFRRDLTWDRKGFVWKSIFVLLIFQHNVVDFLSHSLFAFIWWWVSLQHSAHYHLSVIATSKFISSTIVMRLSCKHSPKIISMTTMVTVREIVYHPWHRRSSKPLSLLLFFPHFIMHQLALSSDQCIPCPLLCTHHNIPFSMWMGLSRGRWG